MIQQQLVDESPLVQAVFAGGCDDVMGLLQEMENPNGRDASGRCALHAAAWRGDFRVVELLLQSDATVSPKDKDWYTPLHWACACNHEAVVELLVDNKADLSARDRCWRTPLHIAAANNAVGCAELLLTQMSNVNVTDRGGHSSLHHAAYNGHHEMAEFLIERNCSVNACDKKERRPLHYASYMGHNDLVRLLYNCGADINAKDKMMWTPLHAAAASGHVLVTEILLELGADKEARTSLGNTPLHVACLNGHANVAAALIAWQAPIHALNQAGQTPLHFAAASTGGGGCLELLLKQGANCNAQSEDGRTPLHMTAVHGRFARSKLLFDHGANIDSVDKMGCTALHIAALHGHELLSTTLLNYKADPSKPGFQGRTPLHMCCLGGYVECCRKIIQAGVDLNCQDSTGKTPLHLAAFKGNVDCLELLVSNKVNVHLADRGGRTALHLAAARGHFECLYTLVVCGSNVNEQDAEGCTPLHLASAYDMEGRCVSYLVTHKAMPLMRDRRGFTAFHYGVAGENETGLQHLLSAVSKVCLYGNDMPKTTPLHLAANCGNSSILKHLLPLFSDTNIKDENGRTALHLAAYQGHEQCVCLLIRCGARICVHDGKAQQTPVHLAALANRGKCLSMLLESSENSAVVDTMDVHKRTPLSLAVGAGNMYCVVILLEAQASVNIVDKDRHPPLFRAVVSGHKEVIELIVEKGGNLLFQDNLGKTALHLAAACGHVSACISLLQACTAKQRALLLAAHDYNNCTPLHYACYNGHASTVQYLLLFSEIKSLEGNAFSPVHCAVFKNSVQCLELLVNRFGGSQVVGLKDKQQRTPLHMAALLNSLPCAQLLLRHDAALEDRDHKGRTPLICAAQKGHHFLIRALLDKKADVRACDKAKNTALHHACSRPTPQHTHCALLLLDATQDSAIVNMPNKHSRTPLHLSARNGLVPVTRLLLERGASPQMVDCNGLTPALACARNPDVAHCLALILSCTPPPTPFYLLNNLKKLSLNISAVGNVFQAPTSPTECNLVRSSNYSSDSDFY